MTIVGPEWIGGDIRDYDRLLSISRCAARSDARADLRSINCVHVFLGKAGSGAVPQSLTVSIQKKNRTEQTRLLLLDLYAQHF
jgi:hypothetical protein